MQTSSVSSIARQMDPATIRAMALRNAATAKFAAQTQHVPAVAVASTARAAETQPASFIANGSRVAPAAPEQPGPLASLFADWGKSGSPWDLDGDGTVGVKDMLSLLEKMGGSPAPQPLPAPATGAATLPSTSIGEQSDQSDPLKALFADWGKSGSIWDLDADGTVGVTDMLALLERMNGPAPQTLPAPQTPPDAPPAPVIQPAPEPADSVAAEGTPATADEPADALAGLKADWGKSDSPWDLNGDGTVNIRDMLTLLERLGTNAAPPAPAADPRLLNMKLMQRLHAMYNTARQGDWMPEAHVKRAISVRG
jgi:Ca2+-binding EF-hand superfamily protein